MLVLKNDPCLRIFFVFALLKRLWVSCSKYNIRNKVTLFWDDYEIKISSDSYTLRRFEITEQHEIEETLKDEEIGTNYKSTLDFWAETMKCSAV